MFALVKLSEENEKKYIILRLFNDLIIVMVSVITAIISILNTSNMVFFGSITSLIAF